MDNLNELATTRPQASPFFDEQSPQSMRRRGEFRRLRTPYRFVLLTMIKIGLIAAISFGPRQPIGCSPDVSGQHGPWAMYWHRTGHDVISGACKGRSRKAHRNTYK